MSGLKDGDVVVEPTVDDRRRDRVLHLVDARRGVGGLGGGGGGFGGGGGGFAGRGG